jgi:hypothetical protein
MDQPDPSPAQTMEVLGAIAFALARSMQDLQRTTFFAALNALAARNRRENQHTVAAVLQQIAAAVEQAGPASPGTTPHTG